MCPGRDRIKTQYFSSSHFLLSVLFRPDQTQTEIGKSVFFCCSVKTWSVSIEVTGVHSGHDCCVWWGPSIIVLLRRDLIFIWPDSRPYANIRIMVSLQTEFLELRVERQKIWYKLQGTSQLNIIFSGPVPWSKPRVLTPPPVEHHGTSTRPRGEYHHGTSLY